MSVDFIIDSHDKIASVGGDWDRFAIENDAPELAGDRIIGRPLLDFISGKVTQHFISTVIDRVRNNQQQIQLEYRCDSATERRFMTMRVAPVEQGNIQFQNDVLYVEPRNVPVVVRRAPQRERGTPVRCSMCNKLNVKPKWVEPEQFTFENQTRFAELLVIYGICECCLSQISPVDAE